MNLMDIHVISKPHYFAKISSSRILDKLVSIFTVSLGLPGGSKINQYKILE
jgi:hypothetical protein